MANFTQANRQLAVNTPLGTDKFMLVGFTGREAISQLFVFHLDLLAENTTNVQFDQLIGQGISIRINLPDKKQRFFHGLCSRISQGARDTNVTTYRMEVVPAFWLLTRNAQSRIFQQKSVPDILKTVLDGFDVEFQLQGTFQPRNYCVQYRETDFNFASRLMEEEGIFYFFKHSNAGHRLVVANHPDAHPAVPEKADLIFEQIVGGPRPSDRIHAWEKFQELRAGKVTLWDHQFELAHKHLEASKVTQDQVQVGTVAHKLKLGANNDLELFDWPGGYAERFDGVGPGGDDKAAELQKVFQDNQRAADIRMQEETLSSLSIEGQSDCRQMTSGHKFNLTRHFNGNGTYVLNSVEHVASSQADFRSGGTQPLLYLNRFTCIPAGLPYRPIRKTPKPIVAGTQTAVVVCPGSEEIFPDKFGRVKVQFHWDRDGKHDLNSSCWLRVAQLFAGKRWGTMFTPRVGHEVLVDFLEGDPDQPVIIGSLYNSENLPHYELPKFKTLSYIKTNSSPGSEGFNELRFEDKKGKEQVFMHSQKRFDIRARGSYFETNGGDRHALIGSQSTEKPGGNFEVTVGGDHDLHVKGNQYDGVDKDFNHVVKGKVVCDYQTSHDLFVKAKSQYNAQEIVIEAATKITLKVGGSFITVEPAGISIVGPMVKINSGGAPTAAVPGLVTDPNDASPADTGEPGDLDKLSGVEEPTIVRKPRVVPSQHGLTVNRLPNGDLQVGNITIKNDPNDPTFQDKVVRDLQHMENTPSGRQRLEDLNNLGQPITIQHTTDGNSTTFNNPADGAAPGKPATDGSTGTGKGTGSVIDYNPDREPPTAADPTINRPADVGLNHELTHAEHGARGTDDNSPDPGNPNNPTIEETETIEEDNKYRSERVLADGRTVPPRKDHTTL